MERGVAPPPPPIAGGHTTSASHSLRMQVSFALAFLLPVLGMSVVFAVYVCLVWYVSTRSAAVAAVAEDNKKADKGLTAKELEKLPVATADDVESGAECAVCLDEIEAGQTVRSLPACHHKFHLACADQWLKKHSACPLCRANLMVPTTIIHKQIDQTPNLNNLDAENLC
ncbi:hypothetical protein Sjap_017392 [Stephania japonica]|uniref:RING-type domain-containing protein n=1 Tax=Stephania japonica TaxID=461633 RepID=A0AAP0I634_9MAGN